MTLKQAFGKLGLEKWVDFLPGHPSKEDEWFIKRFLFQIVWFTFLIDLCSCSQLVGITFKKKLAI
jgi:hypothetical protein